MRTITFYSYKGGTGRTLLLANIARFLVLSGKTVVVLDLDLEAPGLHYKLGMGNTEGGGGRLPVGSGLLDYLLAWQDAGDDPGTAVSDYVIQNVELDPDYEGTLHLFPAGNAPSMEYATGLARLNWWQLLYEERAVPWSQRLGVRALAKIQEFARVDLGADYLLIDSRTGITDIGGVALNVLPDTVVCTMLSNQENIDGISQVVRNLAQKNAAAQASSVEYLVLLTRCERSMVREISKKLSTAVGSPIGSLPGSLGLEVLNSDRDLEFAESFRVDGRHTPNESLLLRDYFRTFRLLGIADDAPTPEARKTIENIASKRGITDSELAYDRTPDRRDESVVSQRIAPGHMADWPGDPWWSWTYHRVTAREPNSLVYLAPTPQRREKPADNRPGDDRFLHLDRFMSSVAKRVGEAIGGDVLIRKAQHFTWDDALASRMLEGEFEISGEPFLLNGLRNHLVEVVEFGTMPKFSLIVDARSSLIDQLNDCLKEIAEPSSTLMSDEPSIVRLAKALIQRKVKFEFGMVGESAVSSECMYYLAGLLGPDSLQPDSLRRIESEREFSEWMTNNPHVALGVCDLILADTVDAPKRGQFMYGRYEPRYLLPFVHPIKVGIPYPARDRGWRRIIAKAFLDAVTNDAQGWGTSRSKGNVHEELRGAGIEPLDAAVLHSRLTLDVPFTDAVRYAGRGIRQAVNRAGSQE